MPTPEVTRTHTSSECLKCGSSQTFGKLSCCARGGSWFEHCGNAGNGLRSHTWYEGIEVCKARHFQTAVDPELHASQAETNASSGDVNTSMNSKTVIVSAYVATSAPANTSALMSDAAPIPASTTTSINTSARMPNDTPVPSTVLLHTPILESATSYTGATTTRAIPALTSTLMHAEVNISTPILLLPPNNPSTNSEKGTIIKLMTTPAHMSARASNIAGERENFPRLFSRVSMIIIFVCWC